MNYLGRIFSRPKGITADAQTPAFDQKLEYVQRKLADYLNEKIRRCTIRSIKLLLTAFCLLTGGYSIYIATRGFAKANSPPEHTKILHRPAVSHVK